MATVREQPARVVIEEPQASRPAPLAEAPVRRPQPPAPVAEAPPAPAPTPAATVAQAERPPPAVTASVDAALTPPSLSGVGFLWPVPTLADGTVMAATSGEGGLLIEASGGEPFVASENGVVVFAADALERFGHMVVVRHDGEYTTSYAHAGDIEVAVGDVVRRGQRLGSVGGTGAAEAKLYFEMRVGSRVVDPRAYLVGAPRLASR